PFLTLPPAFLWAMSLLVLLRGRLLGCRLLGRGGATGLGGWLGVGLGRRLGRGRLGGRLGVGLGLGGGGLLRCGLGLGLVRRRLGLGLRRGLLGRGGELRGELGVLGGLRGGGLLEALPLGLRVRLGLRGSLGRALATEDDVA